MSKICTEEDLEEPYMRIFYLNCHRLLKRNKDEQRDWLIKQIADNDVDVVCLSESSNYDIGVDFPDRFPEQYRLKPSGTTLQKMGYRFNIVSRIPVKYKSIDYSVDTAWHGDKDATSVADYSSGTMISMKFDDFDYEIMPVHIQHKKSKSQTLSANNAFYEYGLQALRSYMMQKKKPLVVFGDFNNYPEDKSFLALTKDTGYTRIADKDVEYTYKRSPIDDYGLVIDHTFTTDTKRVSMVYVDAISQRFDHNGMMISIK
jgi:endonuclease/exonuclease/phosphatase family metal-dependent hydrolase